MTNFKMFDEKLDKEGLKKDIAEAEKNRPEGDYPEIPKGKYEVAIKNIEVKETKKDGRPMLAIDAVIVNGEFKKSHIFMNRVLFGTKNDANMIASAIGWLKKLDTKMDVIFESYEEFADLVLDIAEEVVDKFEYLIEYDPDAFNTISVKEVFELE